MRPPRPPLATLRRALLAGAVAGAGLGAGPALGQGAIPARPPLGAAGPASGPSAGTGISSPGLALPPGLAGSASLDGAAAARPEAARGLSLNPRGRRPAAKRTRPPAVAPFRATIRPTLPDPAVAPDVQPPLAGLPDPAGPILVPRKRPPIEDPYAPLGIRTGGLTFFPVIGQAIGYDTNPNRTAIDRRGSVVSQTEGELTLRSDWSRHELTGFLRGAYNEYLSNPEASRPEGAGRVNLRLDASRDTILDAEGHFLIETQRPGSAELGVAVRERPVVYTEGASAGISQRFNRLVVGLRGTVDRADYDDARLTDGTLLDQSDRAVTQYGARLRVGYELHPGLIPFVEGEADTRVHDRRIDRAGFRRDSDGVGARIGTTFELHRLWSGEVSVGAIQRSYVDPRLADLVAPVADATLAWAVTPLTTVRATAQARVDETTVPGANGIRALRGGLEVAHDLRRNVTLTAGITASDAAYSGVAITERSFGAGLRADWRLNRQVALRASYLFEKLDSTVPGADYAANVFLLGLRLQP